MNRKISVTLSVGTSVKFSEQALLSLSPEMAERVRGRTGYLTALGRGTKGPTAYFPAHDGSPEVRLFDVDPSALVVEPAGQAPAGAPCIREVKAALRKRRAQTVPA